MVQILSRRADATALHTAPIGPQAVMLADIPIRKATIPPGPSAALAPVLMGQTMKLIAPLIVPLTA